MSSLGGSQEWVSSAARPPSAVSHQSTQPRAAGPQQAEPRNLSRTSASGLGPDNADATYWRSLDELADTPRFRAILEQEFPGGAWERMDAPSRRQFLKLMGASIALAGMTGCRWPKEEIVPYTHRPEGMTPGVPQRFATAMEVGGVATGLLVTSYDGRPIKVEGNPSHPFSQGAASAIHQASVLELYDPDRSRAVVRREGEEVLEQNWDRFAAFGKEHFAELRKKKGKGLAILSEATSSPSVARLRKKLYKIMPEAFWFEYEPVSWDNEREAMRKVADKPFRPQYHLDEADVIVCLDADPLMEHPAALRYARDFAKGRRADGGKMNRLYVVESSYSLTGAMADHRLAVQSSRIGAIAYQLIEKLLVSDPEWRKAETRERVLEIFGWPAPPWPARPDPPKLLPVEERFVAALAKDIVAHKGRCVVLAGPQQPPEVHLFALASFALSFGPGEKSWDRLLTARHEPRSNRFLHAGGILSLSRLITHGEIETLVILGGNPVYDAPADVEFSSALGNVETSVHLSLFDDETSTECTWHVPRAHYLESWADARAYDGTVSIVQPLIESLYGGRTSAELLSLLVDDKPATAYEITRKTFATLVEGKDVERSWRKALRDGVVADTAWPKIDIAERKGKIEMSRKFADLATPPPGTEVVFHADPSVHDGRFANNAWLQEWPDPMTRLTWDNAAVISPTTAEHLHLHDGDWIEIAVDKRQITAPVHILPGQANGSIAVSLGYGRTKAGRVGNGVGRNAYALRTTETMGLATGVEIKRVSAPDGAPSPYPFASVQDQHAVRTQVGERAKAERVGVLIREATLAEFKEHPDFAKHVEHHPPLESLWTEHEYGPHRWAMAIDLSACIGCGACVVACQAENNIPVVGKDEVSRGRDMHWMRIDRYFKGDPHEHPRAVHQPVACMHCENAPCEQVCPVAATVHDKEGLNVMVYNRCVGTRYCSNNCPFKVRRFNFFNYQADLPEPRKMVMNPEVTVRGRGVMEKCTYCLQRIMAAKIPAKNERRPIRDGEITPACAQTCPTGAIVFGDLADPNSRVSKLHQSNRAYHLLAGLNLKTRTAYLARLRNPNEALDGGHGHEKKPAHGAGHGHGKKDEHL